MPSTQLNLRTLALTLGPTAGLLVGVLLSQTTVEPNAAITLAVTIWVVIWWITEPIPIPVTALLPLALFPAFEIITARELGAAYGHPLVLLMLGGFIIAASLERSGAHRRLAFFMIRLFGGTSPRRLVLGFMCASAFLSMWISNTSTTLMLLPVAIAVLQLSEDEAKLSTPLLLGIAYAASIGGIGTPIGTPPNMIFMGVYEEISGQAVSFGQWMIWALPIILVMLPIAAFWITRDLKERSQIILPTLDPISVAEKRVLIIFSLTAFCWVTRTGPFGGWSAWFDFPYTNDAMVAFAAIILLFIVPNGEIDKTSGEAQKLLDWATAERIPWGVLILFGSGISIATAFTNSGLSAEIGGALENLALLPIILTMFALCFAVTFLTEVTSNLATTTLLMPILGAAAMGAAVDPMLFMIPAAISASFAFMLPVATPPNAVTFGTGRFSIQTMASEGLALNLCGAFVITAACYMMLS